MSTQEEAIIKDRILVDDRRLATTLKYFLQWAAEEDEEKRTALAERVSLHLDLVEYEAMKSEQVVQMNQREISQYQAQSRQIEADIEKAKREIETLKEQLQQARVLRRNKEEYDVLAAMIQEHPVRKVTERNIEGLNEQIRKLSDEKTELEQQLELRKKQFHALLLSIHELQTILAKESEEKKEEDISETPVANTPLPMEEMADVNMEDAADTDSGRRR